MSNQNFNYEAYGSYLLRSKILTKKNDITTLLISDETIILQKTFPSNNLNKHITFIDSVLEQIQTDQNSKIIMFFSSKNKNSIKKYFKIYWFFVYLLTGIEVVCEFDIINIDLSMSEFTNNLKNSKYIQNIEQLSKSIYNQDIKSWRWIINH